MPKNVVHSCRCGTVQVQVNVPNRRAGTRVTCYCRDCQSTARLHEDAADMLCPAGGTEIWQTTPDQMILLSGAENLHVLRLSPKGLMRWHAGCCGTPMFNTLPNLKMPFVGMIVRQSCLADVTPVYGKSRARVFTDSACVGPDAPGRDKGFAKAGFDVVFRMLTSWLSGRSTQTPLLDPDGNPIAPVYVISEERRAEAVPAHLA